MTAMFISSTERMFIRFIIPPDRQA